MELFMLLCVIGIFSCVSALYKNSRKNTKQLDEIVASLRQIAEKSQDDRSAS